jgi:hypothetical protein
MRHYELTVIGAREKWTQIRWALFVFPDIVDAAPTNDPNVLRVFYEGTRPYPSVWRAELLQAGFDVPALEASGASVPALARTSPGSPPAVPGSGIRAPFTAPVALRRGSGWQRRCR